MAPQRRGPGDPCYQLDADRAIWRTSLQNSGPVTARIRRTAPSTVTCQAWGDGADEFVEALPALLGLGDDAGDFTPHHPVIEAAHRRVPHLRLGRTGRVLEALVPAVLEQRVPGPTRSGPGGCWSPGSADRHPDPPRPGCGCHRRPMFGGASRRGSSTAPTSTRPGPHHRGCAQRAAALERLAGRPVAAARDALTALPGVGIWTAAETAQRAFGDADALSIGDYHIAKMVGWTLIGRPVDDAGMVELLEPVRPHRYRAVRLLEVSGLAVEPRRGARLPVQHIADL